MLPPRFDRRYAVLRRNSSHWSNLWTRGDDDSERLQKDPVKEQLAVRNLKSRDQGTYKVLDKHGLAVSTVQLSVEGQSADPAPGALIGRPIWADRSSN